MVVISLFWGVAGLNRDGISQWDDVKIGNIEWDQDFDLSHPDSQKLIFDLCQDLKSEEYVLNGLIFCFIQGFKEWLDSNSLSFPVPQDQFTQKLIEFTAAFESFEYRSDHEYGFIEGELRLAQIQITTNMKPDRSPEQKDTLMKFWQKKIDSFNESAAQKESTKGVSRALISGGLHVSWSVTEIALKENAVKGMLIAGGLAFAVLLLSTCNIVVAFYAMLGIGGIISSVFAIINILEWQFGVMESISVVVIIGFSVDYVVHLANHYVSSISPVRYRRMQEAYSEMGISILGGAITTFGSGLLLLAAKLVVYFKFGVFITLTISFSLLYSLILFGSLSHLCGPQHKCGSILVCNKNCKKQKEEKSMTNEKTKGPEAEKQDESDRPLEKRNVEIPQPVLVIRKP